MTKKGSGECPIPILLAAYSSFSHGMTHSASASGSFIQIEGVTRSVKPCPGAARQSFGSSRGSEYSCISSVITPPGAHTTASVCPRWISSSTTASKAAHTRPRKSSTLSPSGVPGSLPSIQRKNCSSPFSSAMRRLSKAPKSISDRPGTAVGAQPGYSTSSVWRQRCCGPQKNRTAPG